MGGDGGGATARREKKRGSERHTLDEWEKRCTFLAVNIWSVSSVRRTATNQRALGSIILFAPFEVTIDSQVFLGH